MKKSWFSRWPAQKKLIFSLTSPKKLIFSLTSPKKVDFFADQPKKSWFFCWPAQKKLIFSLTRPKKADFFADRSKKRWFFRWPAPLPPTLPLPPIYIYIYIAIYAYMRMFHAYLWMFPPHLLPHQPTHIHPERGRRFAPPPQRGGRRFALPPPLWIPFWMDVCGSRCDGNIHKYAWNMRMYAYIAIYTYPYIYISIYPWDPKWSHFEYGHNWGQK